VVVRRPCAAAITTQLEAPTIMDCPAVTTRPAATCTVVGWWESVRNWAARHAVKLQPRRNDTAYSYRN